MKSGAVFLKEAIVAVNGKCRKKKKIYDSLRIALCLYIRDGLYPVQAMKF